MDEMTQYNQVRNDEVIGGATGDAQHILYTPAEQGRNKTNVNAELDRINTHLKASIRNNVLATLTSGVDTTLNVDGVLVVNYSTSGAMYGGYTVTVNGVTVSALGQIQTTNPPLVGTASYPVHNGDVVNAHLNTDYGTTGDIKVYQIN